MSYCLFFWNMLFAVSEPSTTIGNPIIKNNTELPCTQVKNKASEAAKKRWRQRKEKERILLLEQESARCV